MGDEKRSEKQGGTETETKVETPGGTRISETEQPSQDQPSKGERRDVIDR